AYVSGRPIGATDPTGLGLWTDLVRDVTWAAAEIRDWFVPQTGEGLYRISEIVDRAGVEYIDSEAESRALVDAFAQAPGAVGNWAGLGVGMGVTSSVPPARMAVSKALIRRIDDFGVQATTGVSRALLSGGDGVLSTTAPSVARALADE